VRAIVRRRNDRQHSTNPLDSTTGLRQGAHVSDVVDHDRTTVSTSTRRHIAAATVGNTLEWFDLAIYGFFAVQISQAFFPGESPASGLVLTFATFAAAYLARPIGAIVLGGYADRYGRKRALVLSIRLMVVGTLVIAVMPTYATIGIAAPVLVLIARLLQGFSTGGEFGSATAFLVEQYPGRRGLMGSFQFASQGLATVLSAVFGSALGAMLSPEQLSAWGWRVPFFFGLLLGPVGWYVRRQVAETPEFERWSEERARQEGRAALPLRELFGRYKTGMLLAAGALIVSTALNHLILYMPSFAVTSLGLPTATSFLAVLLTGTLLTVVTPFSGEISDRFGRTGIMIGSLIVLFIAIYPMFQLLTSYPSVWSLLLLMAGIGLLKALYFGPLPALMAEQFPAAARASGLAISYNVAVTIFGGFTPLVATWLTSTTGTPAAPAFYVMALGVVSFVVLLVVRRRTVHQPAAG
jgi:MHS family proline/betaine transporter-like MFS transporter